MKDFDTESLATALIAIIGGLMNQYWIGGRKMAYERVWIRFSNALLDGIQKEERDK